MEKEAPRLKILSDLVGPQVAPQARVHAIISGHVHNGGQQEMMDDDALDEMNVDPLDRLAITCALDEAFLIEIPDKDAEGWQTVCDVVKTVERLTDGQVA